MPPINSSIHNRISSRCGLSILIQSTNCCRLNAVNLFPAMAYTLSADATTAEIADELKSPLSTTGVTIPLSRQSNESGDDTVVGLAVPNAKHKTIKQEN